MSMKFFKYTLLTAFAIIAHTAVAQQKIDPTLKVEKDFDGTMSNIHKSRLDTNVPDSLSSFNIEFNYSIFDKPYKDLYEFSPLPSVRLQNKVKELYPVLFARVGIGAPLSPLAEIYLQPRLKGGSRLAFNAGYDGYYGKNSLAGYSKEDCMVERISNFKVAAPNSVFKTGINYGYDWKRGSFDLTTGYSNNYYTYYGFNQIEAELDTDRENTIGNASYMKDNFSHTYDQINVGARVASINSRHNSSKFDYLLDISYRYTADKAFEKSFNENLIKINGEISPRMGRLSRLDIGMNMESVGYNGEYYQNESKYTLLEVIPQYSLSKKRLMLKAGIKLSGRFKGETHPANNHRYIFAKAHFSYNLAKNTLWFYADIDGGNNINSYSSILEYNKWIAPANNMDVSSIPFLAKGGFKGQIRQKFSYDLYAKYTVHKGLLQFESNYGTLNSNSLRAIFSDHNEFTVGGSVKWEEKSFRVGASAEYSNYTNGKNSTGFNGFQPIGYAPLKCNIYGEWNWRERIYLGINADAMDSMPIAFASYTIEDKDTGFLTIRHLTYAKGFIDLSVNAKYVINRSLGIFLTGNNLLNSQIQYYENYLQKGISFRAGLLVKL